MSNELTLFKNELAEAKTVQLFINLVGPKNAPKWRQICVMAAEANEYLLQMDRRSLYTAVVHATLSKLDPDPQMGQIYFVPRAGKVQFQAGYKGLMELAFRSKLVTSFATGLVYPGDKFEFEQGTNCFLRHIPAFQTDEPLNATHAYAIARIKGAAKDEFAVIPRAEWMKVKAISDKATKGKGFLWSQFADAAIRKTAIRRLSKFLPMCKELQRIVGVEDQQDADMATEVAPKTTAELMRSQHVKHTGAEEAAINCPGAPGVHTLASAPSALVRQDGETDEAYQQRVDEAADAARRVE